MKRWMVVLASLALAAQVPSAAAATRYNFTRLGAFGYYPTSGAGSSYAYGINELGHVVGYASPPGKTEAYLWTSGGGMIGLGTLQGPASGYSAMSFAFGINETDMVVGYSTSPNYQAFMWNSGGGMVGLGFLPSGGGSPGPTSYAFGVEDMGLIVGYASSDTTYKAIRYDGEMSVLPDISGSAQARAVNNHRDIAGYTLINGSSYQAFVQTSGGNTIWLGTLGVPSTATLASSLAYGINDLGEVVGYSTSPLSSTEAFIWSSALGMRPLGDLPGNNYYSIAYGINNNGQVVGTSISSISGNYDAFLWDATHGMVSLNTLVDGASGWYLREARAINNNGQIVGYGQNPAGAREAFLLTPIVPAPAPAIAFSPTNFAFSAVAGGANPASEPLSISNTGTGTLYWSLSGNPAWVGVMPTSGTVASGAYTYTDVSVITAGMTAGTYATTIEITGNASNSPQSVPVTLTISAPPPAIGFTPAGLTWTINEGSITSTKQQLEITNTGSGTIGWSAAGSQTWIGIAPASGTAASGAYTYADVSVNPTGKTAGTYSGYVVINAPDATNTPQSVPVTMTILPAITVSYPNGGETLRFGRTVTITWNVNAPGQAVSKTDTHYSTNNGSTWTLVKSQAGLASSCAWKVPNKASTTCLVRVQFKNAQGGVIAEDRSNAVFTITK